MKLDEQSIREALRAARAPQTTTWQAITYDGARERSWDEIVGRHGERAAQMAHILRTIETRQLQAPSVGVPSRIFISYRHGSVTHRERVSNLAREFERRGYTVVYDQAEKLPAGADISRLVAEIATCRYFISVVDDGYIESVGDLEGVEMARTWAHIEWQIATLMIEQFGLLKLDLVVEGSRASRGSILSDGVRAGTAFAADTPDKLHRVLDVMFPPVPAADPGAVLAADRLVMRSRQAAFEGDHVSGYQLALEAARRLAENGDTQLRLCLAAIAMNEIDAALEAGRRAAALAPRNAFVRIALVFSELLAGHRKRAQALTREVAHLYADKWRLKFLQLGIEAASGERYAMESCAKAAARIAPVDLKAWARNWRLDLGRPCNELTEIKFAQGRAIPISGEQFAKNGAVNVLQIDKAEPVGTGRVHWVPSLRLADPFSGPQYLSDLNMLLLAHAAASWLPIALERVGWEHLNEADDGAYCKSVALLLENGQIVNITKRTET